MKFINRLFKKYTFKSKIKSGNWTLVQNKKKLYIYKNQSLRNYLIITIFLITLVISIGLFYLK